MSSKKKLSTSKQEREFLKGLLKGKRSIYERVFVPPRYYKLSNEPGICFLIDWVNNMKPVLTDGVYKRFTLEELAEMEKRRPMSVHIMDFGADRPPFPTLEQEEKK